VSEPVNQPDLKIDSWLGLSSDDNALKSRGGPLNETELVNAIEDFYARDVSGIDRNQRVWTYLNKEIGWNEQAMKMIYGKREEFLAKHGLLYHDESIMSAKPRVSEPVNQPDLKIDSRLGLSSDDNALKSRSSPQRSQMNGKYNLNRNSISSNNGKVDTKPAPIYYDGVNYDSKGNNAKPDPMPTSTYYGKTNAELQHISLCDPVRMKSSTHMYTTEIHGKLKPCMGSKRSAPEPEISPLKSAYQTNMVIPKFTVPCIKASCVSEDCEKTVDQTNNCRSRISEKLLSQTKDTVVPSPSYSNPENEEEILTDMQEYYAYLY